MTSPTAHPPWFIGWVQAGGRRWTPVVSAPTAAEVERWLEAFNENGREVILPAGCRPGEDGEEKPAQPPEV